MTMRSAIFGALLGLILPFSAQAQTTPLNDYPDATPVLTDKVWGVDNPAGVWSAKLFQFQAIMDLFEANFEAPTGFIDVIGEIDASLRSGSDLTLITGTAGTNGDLALWNVDGDLIDGPTPPSGAIVGTTDAQTLTNKTIDGDDNTLQDFPAEIGLAASDETTDLTTGTAKVTFRMPYAMMLTAVRASVTTAPAGSVITVDLNESGTTILSTKVTIDAGEKTSETAATEEVISDSALANDAEMTVDIDGVGSSTAGTGLKVWLIGKRS